MPSLDVFAGATARARLAKRGWDPELFTLLLGASGGPKWLVLGGLDRVLFGDFLRRRTTPLTVYGSSIGAWRHACLAQDDPVAALERFERAYIHQTYASERPGPEEITAVSREILGRLLGEDGGRQILESPRFATQICTARGRGPTASGRRGLHGIGLGLAALSNALDRRLLQPWYQRVVFSRSGDAGASGLAFRDFSTTYAPLTSDNVEAAILASGSIPLVLVGVDDPPDAPPGRYWDGGIVDYHHDLTAYRGEGLVLYPHFFGHITPGWFDKRFAGRRPRGEVLDRLVLLAPSDAFVARLPGGAIPDRTDFDRLAPEARIEAWWRVVHLARELGEELEALLGGDDPLRGVRPFPS